MKIQTSAFDLKQCGLNVWLDGGSIECCILDVEHDDEWMKTQCSRD